MTPSGRMGRWMEQRRGGDVFRAHPGAQQGPSSSSLRSPIWEVGDVGPEAPLIPLQVGGEPRPNLGLACVDRGRLRGCILPRAFCF